MRPWTTRTEDDAFSFATIGLAAALLGATLAGGCLSGTTSEDAPNEGPAQLTAEQAAAVAADPARSWASDARLAAALALEAPNRDVLQAVHEQGSVKMPGWLLGLADRHQDPNVADGEAPFWVLRFVSDEQEAGKGFVVIGPNRTVSPLPDDVPVGHTEDLGGWSVNGSAAIETARASGMAPGEGTTEAGVMTVLVPAKGAQGTSPAWKIQPLIPGGDGSSVIIDARSGEVLTGAR